MTRVLVLAAVQGLTEFIPVSSSGHLALCSRLFPPTPTDFFLMVFLHGGTLGAVYFFFRRDIAMLARSVGLPRRKSDENAGFIGKVPGRLYLKAVVIGSLPVIALGPLLKGRAEEVFHSLPALAAAFAVTAAWLALSAAARGGKARPLSTRRALLVGLAQAGALFPGISRSGSTIVAGLLTGLSREEAFRFSFLLSLPAVTAAFAWEALTVRGALPGAGALAAGTAVSFLVGLGALHLLRRTVVSGRLYYFSIYLFLLAALILAPGLFGRA